MRLEYTIRPIDRWPQKGTPPEDRHGSRVFKADWNDTAHKLAYEVEKIDGSNVVLMVAVDESQIRQDGQLRVDAKFRHPGVIVAFDSKFGPLKLPCDACREWRHNVRAVAYHLEHLRLAGLYGVGRFGEQYTGWKQLPPAIVTPPPMTVEEAAGVMEQAADAGGLMTLAEFVMRDAAAFTSAYRAGCKAYHPDANGGNHTESWNVLQAAADVLRRHLGI